MDKDEGIVHKPTLRDTLPRETKLLGVVVEIFPYEVGQPFKKTLHHQ